MVAGSSPPAAGSSSRPRAINPNWRITEALAISALLHGWIFAPLQPWDGVGESHFAPGALTVTIQRAQEQPAEEEARAPLLAAVAAERDATRPASADPVAPAAARGKTRNISHESSDTTRPAHPDELTVSVLLLEAEGQYKPQEHLAIDGKRYVYFNAPGLKRHVRPLRALRQRYPALPPDDPHGLVVLRLLISEHGALEQVKALCAAPAFEHSARASIEGMRFAPAQGERGPVRSYMLVEFVYGGGERCK